MSGANVGLRCLLIYAALRCNASRQDMPIIELHEFTVSSLWTSWYFWVSFTPDIGTLAWAPLNCRGGSPVSRTTRAHSPAPGRTRDYSDWDICHKPRTRNPRAGWTAGRHGQESNLRPSDLRSDALPLRYHAIIEFHKVKCVTCGSFGSDSHAY